MSHRSNAAKRTETHGITQVHVCWYFLSLLICYLWISDLREVSWVVLRWYFRRAAIRVVREGHFKRSERNHIWCYRLFYIVSFVCCNATVLYLYSAKLFHIFMWLVFLGFFLEIYCIYKNDVNVLWTFDQFVRNIINKIIFLILWVAKFRRRIV